MTKFFAGIMCLWLAGIVAAQEPAPKRAEPLEDGALDLSKFPGTVIDDVVVPVPSEIFSIMGKLGEESFGGEIVSRQDLRSRNRSRLALAFGISVADGFIAVQAQNRKGIEDAGRTALKLSETLGLKDPVLKHTQRIIKAAERDDWPEVRNELDKTQKTVRDTMEEMRDGDLANCVSIGGWIRGTEAMTALIARSYKDEQAELLNQPDLAHHFSKLIGQMDEKVRAVDQVKAADACLKVVGGLMAEDGAQLDRGAVSEINAASKSFVASVFSGDLEGGAKP